MITRTLAKATNPTNEGRNTLQNNVTLESLSDSLQRILKLLDKQDTDKEFRKQIADIHKVIFPESVKQNVDEKRAIRRAKMRLDLLGGLK